MKRKKRTEVDLEIHEILFVKRRAGSALVWCTKCAAEVPMITPDEAAAIAATSTRAVYRWIEGDEFHWTETPNRRLLVCLPSLLASTTRDLVNKATKCR